MCNKLLIFIHAYGVHSISQCRIHEVANLERKVLVEVFKLGDQAMPNTNNYIPAIGFKGILL